MKKIEDKMNTISLLESFTDEMFSRYYITNPPILKKSDKVSLGYGSNKTKETQSVNFGFYTSKPSEDEMKIFIELFVSKWMRMGNR